jgi:hypothetical protein
MKTSNADAIVVNGKVPFCLLLEDSIGESGNLDNSKVIEIVPESNDFKAGLFFKKIISPLQQGPIVATEDLFGEMTYTEFCVVFKKELTTQKDLSSIFKTNADRFDNEHITEVVAKLINKFTSIYKAEWKNEKDWIPSITKFRMSPWSIFVLNKKGQRIDGIRVLDYRGTGIMIGNSTNPEQLDKIKRMCLRPDVKIETAARFCQEVNRFKKTGDYIPAIIFLAAYIEKFIFREIRYKLEKDGKTPEEIRAFLRKKRDPNRYIHRYDAIEKITGSRSFKETDEFKDYETYIVAPRNAIAHDDPVEMDDAFIDKTTSVSINFRNYLIKVIWEK